VSKKFVVFEKESRIPRGQGFWVGVENPVKSKGIWNLNGSSFLGGS